MKTLLLTLTYLVGIGELILAIYFWVTNSKNEIRRVMALLAFSTGMWALTNALSSYTDPSTAVNFILSLVFVSGILIVTTLLQLVLIFPFKLWYFDRWHAILLYIPVVIFSYIAIFTNTIISSYIIAKDNPGYVIPGPVFIPYQIYVSVIFLISLATLLIKINKTDVSNKHNAIIFFWSVAIGGLPAIIFNLWFVFFGASVNPLIPVVCSISWIGGTSYILLKK